MLNGSCACGRIPDKIAGDLIGSLTYCHCLRCRTHFGSSFGTKAGAVATDFTSTHGETLLASWESSPGIQRSFTRCYGAPIYERDSSSTNELGFRLGTLDTDPGLKGELHFVAGSKVLWLEICDHLPRDFAGSPFGKRD
jgi:hypothetical protein